MLLSRYEPDALVVWVGVNNAWNRKDTDTRADSGFVRIDPLFLRSRLHRMGRVFAPDLDLESHRLPDLHHGAPPYSFVAHGGTPQSSWGHSGVSSAREAPSEQVGTHP